MQSAQDVVHWVKIVVLDNKRNRVECLIWKGLIWDLRMKYDWYFKYRAALCQVLNPKCEVQFIWGNEPATGKSLEQILKGKQIALKGKITKNKNKLSEFISQFEEYKSKYCGLFPIETQDEFKMYVSSIELAQAKIRKLENELNKITKQNS